MPYPLPSTQSSNTSTIKTSVSGAVCWLKLSFQYSIIHEADWKTLLSGLEYNTLQLDIGPTQKQTPDCWDWQSHLLYFSAKPSPPGLCAQPPPVHTVHSKTIHRTLLWIMWMTPSPSVKKKKVKLKKQTQKRLYFLRKLNKAKFCCNRNLAQNRKHLQWVTKTAQNIIGAHLQSSSDVGWVKHLHRMLYQFSTFT